MAEVVGLTLIKRFTYRGDTMEEYSNKYFLTGPIPADSTAWKALADDVAGNEKLLYPPSCRVVHAYGYDTDADKPVSVWSWDYSLTPIVGTCGTSGTIPAPGDAAVWARWKTSRLNEDGKPIYLRKYYHPVLLDAATGGDGVHANQKGNLATFATYMNSGSIVGSRKIRSRLHEETIIATGNSLYATTRTLKRRGKRPGSSAP